MRIANDELFLDYRDALRLDLNDALSFSSCCFASYLIDSCLMDSCLMDFYLMDSCLMDFYLKDSCLMDFYLMDSCLMDFYFTAPFFILEAIEISNDSVSRSLLITTYFILFLPENRSADEGSSLIVLIFIMV